MTRLTEDEFFVMYGCTQNDDGTILADEADTAALTAALGARRLWTMVEGDDDQLALLSGLRRVNRIGYVIADRPYPEHTELEVSLDRE